jgi:hypothetical protein
MDKEDGNLLPEVMMKISRRLWHTLENSFGEKSPVFFNKKYIKAIFKQFPKAALHG